MSSTKKDVIIGVDPHKMSVTIEVVDTHERLLGSGRFDTTDEDSSERDVQRRMLIRRHAPVDIPAADRAPHDVPSPYSNGTRNT